MTSDLSPLYRAQSLAEQAYQVIREGIATGVFGSGERVTERGLATRLQVSPTPIREALRRLEQEGLIERISARQLRVVDHSAQTVRELMLTGAALRAMEARFATPKITDDALERMELLIGPLTRGGTVDDQERLRIAREFDAEIERAADNPALRNMIVGLSVVGQGRRGRSSDATATPQDYHDIITAFRGRDPDQVETTFRRYANADIERHLADL